MSPAGPGPVLDGTARRLRVHLARAQTSGRLPSLVAGLVRDGALVWSDGYGDVPGDPDGVQYRIGSITKTMTAVVVHQLVAEGRLGLDDPVSAVLGDVGGYGASTVRSLLAHDSGMQAEPAGDWWERTAGSTFDELVAANDGSGRVFAPLRQFHYSNVGFALLGEVVARLRGATWWECVRERVLEPLGMDRTSYLPEAPAAQGFSVDPYAGTLHREPATDTGAMAPAGQVWSTVRDLATYAAFLADGHPGVLSREALLAASHPQVGDRDAALAGGYGLGFQLFGSPQGLLVGHGGSMPGFLATIVVDRARRTGCVAFANATTGLSGELTRNLLAELEACEPFLPPAWQPTGQVPDALAPLLGVWHWGNTAFTFTLEGDEVVARAGGFDKWRFGERDGRAVGTRGYHAGEEVRVVRHDDGSVSHLDVATFVLSRAPYDPAVPHPGGLPR